MWKWKETSTRDFCRKLSKKNSDGCLQNLATFWKWFSGENKEEKQQHYMTLKQIRYFNVINIVECWCNTEGSVMIQSWSTQFPTATFSQMALYDSWTMSYVSAMCEKVGHMEMQMFPFLRNSIIVSFIFSTTFSHTESNTQRDSAKCQLLRLYSQFSFTKILKALQALIFTSFWGNFPRISQKRSLLTSTNVTETSSKSHFCAYF